MAERSVRVPPQMDMRWRGVLTAKVTPLVSGTLVTRGFKGQAAPGRVAMALAVMALLSDTLISEA